MNRKKSFQIYIIAVQNRIKSNKAIKEPADSKWADSKGIRKDSKDE
jgi:hypothetical protein